VKLEGTNKPNVMAVAEIYGLVAVVYGMVAEVYGGAVVQTCGGGVTKVIQTQNSN
jgi:hypothetical protein